MVLGVVLIAVIIFPRHMSALVHKLADWAGRRSKRVAARLEGLRTGIDQAHESVVAFNTPRGWLALLEATLLSAPSHANKLLAVTSPCAPLASTRTSWTSCCCRR